MDWDGGAYEIAQGEAFATACARLERLEPGRLQQVVYGTAPLRKWDKAFVVEPPIHLPYCRVAQAPLLHGQVDHGVVVRIVFQDN